MLLQTVMGTGVEILSAGSGEEALLAASGQSPVDLVITDIVMGGVDGFEMADQLFQIGFARRFLFISGYCNKQEIQGRMAPYETAAFLAKPFTIPQFLRAIDDLIDQERPLAKGVGSGS